MSQDISRRNFLKAACLSIAGASASALALGGCKKKEKEGPSGKASATAQGKGGEVKVTVELDKGVITVVDVQGDGEYPNIGTTAIEEMPQSIIDAQSFEVDGTAGATITSNAIKQAGKEAYKQITGEK